MKIEGDYAIIETAEEAVLFLGESIDSPDDDGRIYGSELRGVKYGRIWANQEKGIILESSDYDEHIEKFHAMITRPQVLEAITPKEGDAVFIWGDLLYRKSIDSDPPEYWVRKESAKWCGMIDMVKANALTIGKTVGELRELLAWARGES